MFTSLCACFQKWVLFFFKKIFIIGVRFDMKNPSIRVRNKTYRR